MKLDRRSFIKLISVATTAVASGCTGLAWFLGETVRGLERGFQPTDFPIEWNTDQPTNVDLDTYRLKIDGDISKPLEFTIDDLRAMPQVWKFLSLGCSHKTARWKGTISCEGIPLSHFLDLAGVSLESIDFVRFGAVTGYRARLESDVVANPDNTIVLKAEGAPLAVGHGFPARLLAPTADPHKCVKYVNSITIKRKKES
jgi:DMSO/TMAO reductase YedYZ molybdopterin-dependent catalytic subunit